MIRKAPKVMEPLIAMAASGDVTADDLRAKLATWDKGQVERNGFHLLQAAARDPSIAAVAMKFSVVHEALGSMPWTLWEPLSATIPRGNGHGRLSDEDAVRYSTYVLDVLKVRTYPGLVYQACYFGWVECARLFKDRGLYAPLEWQGYSGTTDDDRLRFVRTLLAAIDPPAEHLLMLREGLPKGSEAVTMIDMATAEPAGMAH
jgi:hypothetical protein